MPGKDPVQLTERTANRLIRDAAEWEGFVRGHPPRNRRPMPSDDSGILWGKGYQNWVKVAGNGSWLPAHPVTNKAGEDEDAEIDLAIYLPRNGSLYDPNVVDDAVIPYIIDSAGDAICVGEYLDGTIAKSVQVWEGAPGDLATEKPAWTILTRIGGKFMAGYAASGDTDYTTITNTGGYKWHGETENNHTIHNLAHTHVINPALTCVDANQDAAVVARWDTPTAAATWTDLNAGHDGPYNSSQDTDNRPTYALLFLIVRADNSAAAP